jgi:hypothetical protein
MSDARGTLDVERAYDCEDGAPCATCGEDIFDGDWMTWEPAGIPEYPRMVLMCHPACSVSNGFRLRYPS